MPVGKVTAGNSILQPSGARSLIPHDFRIRILDIPFGKYPHLSRGPQQMAADYQQMGADHEQMAAGDQQMAADDQQMTADHQQMAADDQQKAAALQRCLRTGDRAECPRSGRGIFVNVSGRARPRIAGFFGSCENRRSS